MEPGHALASAFPLTRAPDPLKIFNQYGEGGYLAYRLSAHGDRVYIFGDAALMGDALLHSYGDVESVTPRWDSIVRGAGTDYHFNYIRSWDVASDGSVTFGVKP